MPAKTRSQSKAQRLSNMVEGNKTFKDENGNSLVVGEQLSFNGDDSGTTRAKLQIHDRIRAPEMRSSLHANLEEVVEIRVVREESPNGIGPETGLLRKLVTSSNGAFLRVDWDYFPRDDSPWTPEDFGVNPAEFHGAYCVRASVNQRMVCVCGISVD